MPRAGGEAEKLGNYYESIWTVDSLLDLLSDDAVALQPELYDESEAEGIEFIKTLANGAIEHHSVKRQKVGIAWSLADLARTKPNGRSILADLFDKLASDPHSYAVFVSQTGVNELLELCQRARRCDQPSDLDEQLKTSKAVAEDFRSYVLPLCAQQASVALDRLKRLRAVPFEETELLRRGAQKKAPRMFKTQRNEGVP